MVRIVAVQGLRTLTGLFLATLFCLCGGAQQTVSFRNDVLPILEERCQTCHQAGSGEASLSLVRHQDLLTGGRSGPAVVPGKPADSLIVAKVSGERPAMPKVGEPLLQEQVRLISRWIEEGASDDTAGGPAGTGTWWSFRPLERPRIPGEQDSWSRTPIDPFVLAKLRAQGMEPSPEANRRTLIRRVTYDLHGLPPTPEQVESFANDPSPNAYERLVDRLLASPRYGERWGRHWLDVVHYGDTHGFDQDRRRLNAWPYRDYVIRSLNEDKAYERFVREQLAGDVLRPDDADSVVATGFIAAGPWDFAAHSTLQEETFNRKMARLLDRDDMVASTMSTFSSVTVHCARCHDHKFDPVKQEDYYSLQAVFAGVERIDRPFDMDPGVSETRRKLRETQRRIAIESRAILDEAKTRTSPEIEAAEARVHPLIDKRALLLNSMTLGQTSEGRAKNEEIGAKIELLNEKLRLVESRVEQLQLDMLEPSRTARLAELRAQMQEAKAALRQLPEPGWVYAVDRYFDQVFNIAPPLTPRPIRLLHRGSPDAPGELVGPGALSAVKGLEARFENVPPGEEGARRLALAEWIVARDNPLTWRSIVNRLWHYHFGKGIVDTPNDFGRMGTRPTHPELLDWLATEFRDSGQSMKRLHRMILTSSVYRQSSDDNPAFSAVDAGNRFLWRMNRRRLDAESVRDSVLHAAGNLDLTVGGPPAEQFVYIEDFSPRFDYASFDVDSPASYRRSVFRFVVRSVQDPFMESLDCADPSALTPKRNVTLTAIQALAMLNDPLVLSQARQLAERARARADELPAQLEQAYRLLLGRRPLESDAQLLVPYAAVPWTGKALLAALQQQRIHVCRLEGGQCDTTAIAGLIRSICPLRKRIRTRWTGGSSCGTGAAAWEALPSPISWDDLACSPRRIRSRGPS